MKNTVCFIITCAIFATVGCNKLRQTEKGTLTINLMADTKRNMLKTKSEIDPSSFSLEVWRGATLTAKFSPIGVGYKTITLDAATYTISAFSDRFSAPKFDMPIYGETQMVTINKDEDKTLTLNCAQTNSGVTIVYSNEFKATHTKYSATITQPEGYLTYSSTETRRGYFLSKGVVLTISADGSDHKKSLILAPQTDYDIEIEQTQTGTKGQLSIIINVITDVKKESITIDLPNDGTPPTPPTGNVDIDYHEALGTTMSNSTLEAYTDWSYASAIYTGNGVSIRSDSESDNPGASGFDNLYITAGGIFKISGINSLNTDVSNVSLSFGCRARSGIFKTEELKVSVSKDGVNYINLPYTRSEDLNWEEVIISNGIPRTDNLHISFQSFATFYLDDIKLITD